MKKTEIKVGDVVKSKGQLYMVTALGSDNNYTTSKRVAVGKYDEDTGKVGKFRHLLWIKDCQYVSHPIRYRNMSVQQGAELVMSKFPKSWIEYAASPERGEYAGFAALHDKCDANMLLPFCEVARTNSDEYLAFCNAVMERVSQIILATRKPIPDAWDILATLVNLHDGIKDGGKGITKEDWAMARAAIKQCNTSPKFSK